MSQISRKQAVPRSVAALASVCLMLQLVLAGFALGLTSASAAEAGVTCAVSSVPSVDGRTQAPATGAAHHGLCCILHASALPSASAPRVKPVIVAFPTEKLRAPRAENERILQPVASRCAPQSPRAPPAHA